MTAPLIAEALRRDHHNFAAIRLALALAVVLSHAFSVTTGTVDNEPLFRGTGFTLGEHAVNGFFAVSGFLVTMSYDRRGWRDYVVARVLRIAPGLVGATLVVALAIGGALTRLPLPEYLASPGLWRFISGTLTTFKSNAALPGVFETNPFRFPMGTVWTLKYEVLCYLGVLAAGIAGLLRRPWTALVLVGGLFLGLAALETSGPNLAKGVETAFRLPLMFAAGSALYLWRDRAPVSAILAGALAGGATLAKGTPLYPGLLFLAEAYGVIWLALAPKLSQPSLDFETDLSYGVYLYGWPAQQALRALFPEAGAAALLVLSLAGTLALALLSWILVERPALRLKRIWLDRPRAGAADPLPEPRSP